MKLSVGPSRIAFMEISLNCGSKDLTLHGDGGCMPLAVTRFHCNRILLVFLEENPVSDLWKVKVIGCLCKRFHIGCYAAGCCYLSMLI